MHSLLHVVSNTCFPYLEVDSRGIQRPRKAFKALLTCSSLVCPMRLRSYVGARR